MKPLTVRAARLEDVPRILEIQGLCPEAARWTAAQYRGAIEEDSPLRCLVADRQGEVAGFLIHRGPVSGESEILNLAVDPAQRREGLGRTLVDHVHAASPGSVFLEVRESNRGGIAFYSSLGFRQVGRRRRFYRNPTEDAVVMRSS